MSSDDDFIRKKLLSAFMQELLNAYTTGNKDDDEIRREFLSALYGENVQELQSLTEKYGLDYPYASLKNKLGGNFLHSVAKDGKNTACKFLLKVLKFDINSTDNRGNTPLFEACWYAQWHTARLLINSGADITINTILGANVLHGAAREGNASLLRYLLVDRKMSPNCNSREFGTPLFHSMTAGSIECMELLLQAEANPNEEISGIETTPLGLSGITGNTEMIECLLRYGADPNKSDSEGKKAIERAAMCGYSAAVRLLFPATSRIEGYPDWSVSGIIQENMKRLYVQKKEEGNKAFKNGKFDVAMKCYNQAIAADSTAAEVYSNRSLCWMRLGKAEESLADAKTCVKLNPNLVKGHFREGTAWMALKNFQQAAKAFSEALALKPDEIETRRIQQALWSAQAGLNNC